jgi:transcriptional regulator with GAF, ATPase, and Fis domain
MSEIRPPHAPLNEVKHLISAASEEPQHLLNTLHLINQEQDIHKLLQALLDTVLQLTQAERGYVRYRSLSHAEELHFARNMEGQDIQDPYFQFSQNVIQLVLEQGCALFSENALEDPRFQKFDSVQDLQLLSILCVPLKVHSQICGSLFLENRKVFHLFHQDSLQQAQAYAHQFALALYKSELIEENRRKAEELSRLNGILTQKVRQQHQELQEASKLLRRSFCHLVGTSPPMKKVFRRIEKCSQTPLPVLITGESGTGKELVAKAIHYSSTRKHQVFVAENCAGLSESVLESELFGHEKGAFTGAFTQKKGLFEQAQGGTLFLDEIAETSVHLQKKLLRVIQEGTLRRVGGSDSLQVDVRIVSATNKPIEALVEKGLFREDLFYRLSVLRIELPPLRERLSDIPGLVQHFLQEIAQKNHTPLKSISPTLLQLLAQKQWPGNVRQLYNVLQRLVAFTDGDEITEVKLLEEFFQADSPYLKLPPSSDYFQIPLSSLPEMIEALEQQALESSLQRSNGNKTKAAEWLGISRYTLLRKLNRSDKHDDTSSNSSDCAELGR